jgi:thiosulfate/3-mercaptopyruvate sulfurtransferase
VRYRFVDCRWDIADPARGRELYLEGHVPGASFLDVEADLSAPPGPRGRHPLPSERDFAAAASRAGIGADTFVVAYGNMGGAERLWWLLRHFGHDACAVIELDAWRGPLRAGDEEIEPAAFAPRARRDDTIEADELAERLGELVVVDTRVPGRWSGEENPIDRVPGRIPGALNAPWDAPLPELPDGELVLPRERGQ